jgi:hypothetical protein
LGKNFNNSLKIGPNVFLSHFKNNIIFNLVKFVTTKKSMKTNFFSPLSFVTVFGSGIRDPRSGIRDPGSGMGKNQDPGSGIREKHPGSATLGFAFIFSGSRSRPFDEFQCGSGPELFYQCVFRLTAFC